MLGPVYLSNGLSPNIIVDTCVYCLVSILPLSSNNIPHFFGKLPLPNFQPCILGEIALAKPYDQVQGGYLTELERKRHLSELLRK